MTKFPTINAPLTEAESGEHNVVCMKCRKPFTESREAWSEWQVAALRRMWAAGDSGSQIANAIGQTRSAVLGKAMRLELPARAVPRHGEQRLNRLVSGTPAIPRIGFQDRRFAWELGE
jgi:hypothetical protein